MIGRISVSYSNGTYDSLAIERDFDTPFCKYLDILRSVARDYCCAFRSCSSVYIEVGSIKRCVVRYYYTEKGVVVLEKIL